MTSIAEQVFSYACSGNLSAIIEYYLQGGDLNVTYNKFGEEHSLIMGAFRNRQYDVVIWLKRHGCVLTSNEQREINNEYKKIKTIEFLASKFLTGK